MARMAAVLMAVVLVLPLTISTLLAAAPKAYVGLFRDDAVAVIDTASNRVVRTIPVPKARTVSWSRPTAGRRTYRATAPRPSP